MRLILVCHGEVQAEDQRFYGDDDPELSDRGRDQAEAIARELQAAYEAIDGVLTSPLRCAAETAGRIARALEMGLDQPEEHRRLLTPKDDSLTALAAIQERAWSIVEMLQQTRPDTSRIVLVTHARTIHALVCKALSMPVENFDRFRIEPASISLLDFRPNRPQRTLVAGLNQTNHLESQ